MDKTKLKFNIVLDVEKEWQYTLTKFKKSVGYYYGWTNPEGVIASGAHCLYKSKAEARNDVLKRIVDFKVSFPNRKFELR